MNSAEIKEYKNSIWKKSEIYYLSLAGGIIGIIYAVNSGWMPIMIIATAIGIAGFVAHLMSDRFDNRGLAFLSAYGWIPVVMVILSYLIQCHGFYNDAFFIGLVLLPSICAPVWWLWKGNDISVKIYSIYLLSMMAFWVLLRFVYLPFYIPAAIIFYGSVLIAVIWMIAIFPKIFVKYSGVNVGPFLLFWLVIMLLDIMLFQVVPWVSNGTAMFTDIPWAQ